MKNEDKLDLVSTRREHEANRIRVLADAIETYIRKNEPVPMDWFTELSDLVSNYVSWEDS